uniref:BRICHOS domain-containing protein n=1 Tax=Cyanistes caeruleus TaxID=156563 RepID=A0A8C0UTY1_CYACU
AICRVIDLLSLTVLNISGSGYLCQPKIQIGGLRHVDMDLVKNTNKCHCEPFLTIQPRFFPSQGYIATRLFSRNACFIMKIKKDLIPELREIGRLAFERQVRCGEQRGESSLHPALQPLRDDFDWILYGKYIENLCTGLPLYQLVSTQRKSQPRASCPL